MVNLRGLTAGLLAAYNLADVVSGHPGEHHNAEELRAELIRRDAHAAVIARGLRACAGKQSYEQLMRRASERLSGKATLLRKERGVEEALPYLTRRDLAALKEAEAKDHNLTSEGFAKKTKPAKLFAVYKNISCVLMPEVTQGPYWITGEYIRSNVVESQKGVPVHLEYQFIDISTCDAAPNLYIDIWHVNSTGVYSGVVANGNGNYQDKTNLNATYLRGAQKTNKHGVAAFDTIFPGHYQGRTTHVHMMAHQNVTVRKNGTYTGGTISHVGQIFFEEDLKSVIEATRPYKTNTQTSTTNNEDSIAAQQASDDFDPFPDYAYLGDDVKDGLLMWIAVGVDLSAAYEVSSAGELTANGGVASSGGGSGPPSGAPPN